MILYFSDTVCVLIRSSSLPAREGALESSKGDAKGDPKAAPPLPPLTSELQLDRREDMADADREGPSNGESTYGLGAFDREEGGNRRESVDSNEAYSEFWVPPNLDACVTGARG